MEKQAATPKVKDAVQTQAEQLDAWLKHAREQRAVELIKQIRKRLVKMDEIAEAFVKAWQTQRGRRKPVRKPALAALDAFVTLSDEIPMLDAGNSARLSQGREECPIHERGRWRTIPSQRRSGEPSSECKTGLAIGTTG